MEVIDEWNSLPDEVRAFTQALRDRLHDFSPRIVTVHCYRDLGHRWLHLVFDRTIAPDVVLRTGAALASLPGIEGLHFNSLRPRAVFFLVEPTAESVPPLPVARYGERLADLARAWQARDG